MTEKKWYAWVVRRNYFDHVIRYIKDNCPEIDKFFYPQIKKEYETKKGIKVKDRPLYEGYLFLHYDNHPVVFHKLSSYPFITTFAGKVEEEEIKRMEDVQGKLISEIRTSKFRKDDTVVLLDGPFKGYEANVVEVEGDLIKVSVNAQLFGKDIQVPVSQDHVEKKTELQNSKVQNLKATNEEG